MQHKVNPSPVGGAGDKVATSPLGQAAGLAEEDDEDIRLMAAHLMREPVPPPTVPVYALPDQEYLEATILPLLLRGLEELSKVRPPDPLTFLAAYLIGNNPQRSATPLINNIDGRRVPLMEIAMRGAAAFDLFQTAPKETRTSILEETTLSAPK